MMAFLAAGLAAVGAADGGDVAALQHLWPGVRDSSEQVVMSLERGAALWPLQSERRVRTVVAPVAAPWLGAHVLYLEEFLEDEPEVPRRQLLMLLEPRGDQEHVVRVRLFTFLAPQRWTHLNYRPALLAQLAWQDLASSSGCELLLNRAGDQFHGGTLGRHCLDYSAGAARYLDYQLVISQDLYWYRRRVLRQSDGELQQEVIGFNRFEPSEARLYACRVAWSASGRRARPAAAPDPRPVRGRRPRTVRHARRAHAGADPARARLAVCARSRRAAAAAAGAGRRHPVCHRLGADGRAAHRTRARLAAGALRGDRAGLGRAGSVSGARRDRAQVLQQAAR